MNTLITKVFLLLGFAFCVGCSSPSVPEGSDGFNHEQWQQLPAPITHRYSALELKPLEQTMGQPERIDPIKDFSCTELERSTVTDNIPLIDVSFIEADINDALLELSLLTGVSLITDDNIEGLVSINFIGKSLDEVLTAIIAPGNYGYKKYDSFVFVGSQSPVSPSFHLLSNTCLYKPVFLQPEQIVELLTPFYQQYVNYLAGHDHLSIVAPETIQQRIQQDIIIFDQAPEQILLEMSIIEISSEALDLLGVKWNQEIKASDFSGLTNRNQMYKFYDPRQASSSVAQALINSVSALNVSEEVQVKATPSLVTLNGREAYFSSTQTTWLPNSSGSGNVRQEINYGVDLRIIPYISRDNNIRLEILQASVSDLAEGFDGQPKLISHSISTSVLMLDGETLILGGLLQKKSRNQHNSVPGASAIPFVGGLFRHRDSELVSTEVLIVIRPKILGG